ncbi:hypothetical protein TNCV_1627611 [Trichonephila clavipes]|nr:hypothetical protein TNCV_1627611 [Trichonephila clavipes]
MERRRRGKIERATEQNWTYPFRQGSKNSADDTRTKITTVAPQHHSRKIGWWKGGVEQEKKQNSLIAADDSKNSAALLAFACPLTADGMLFLPHDGFRR